MCKYECFGDYYRGCQHYVKRYQSGEKIDCQSEACKGSDRHKHHPNEHCRCENVADEELRVVNLFQFKCDPCLETSRTSRPYR